jgi:DNA mismatch repair ATPase MutS
MVREHTAANNEKFSKVDLLKTLHISNTPIWKSVSPNKHTDMKPSFSTSEINLHITNFFRLRQGLSLSSYGTNCAALSGIPQEVITRADMYTQLQNRGEDLVGIIRGESDEREMKELKIAEEIAKKFVAWEIDVIPTGRLRDELVMILS